MSTIHPQLTVSTWFQLCENYARSFTSIGHVDDAECHFTRVVDLEAEGAAFTKLKSPALVASFYETTGVDKDSDNRMALRTLSFMVCKKLPGGTASHQMKVDYLDQCETMALQVLGRIKRDSDDRTTPRKFNRVITDQWQGYSYEFAPGTAGNWVGYRIEVPVLNPERRLVYDPGLWDDDAAQPLLFDLTQLSCANLNDATLGLTTAQRTNCLYVTVKDSDGNTVTTVPAGGIYTLPEEMVTILPYDDPAAALADTTVVPTTAQTVRVLSTRREYAGDGTSTVAQLVTAQAYLLPVSEQGDGLHTTAFGADNIIQTIEA